MPIFNTKIINRNSSDTHQQAEYVDGVTSGAL